MASAEITAPNAVAASKYKVGSVEAASMDRVDATRSVNVEEEKWRVDEKKCRWAKKGVVGLRNAGE